MAVKQTQYMATGRRKEAIARVRVIPGGRGRILINGKAYDSYFVTVDQKTQVVQPLQVVEMENKVDVFVRVTGGGINGQAGAVSLGISRGLVMLNPELKTGLKRQALLTRDPRAKERKKYGRRGARRRFQWTKR